MVAESPKRRVRLPRVLEPHFIQWRRDLRTVVAGLRGQRAPTWLPRDGSRYPSAAPSKHIATRELEIIEVTRETRSAVSLIFRAADGQPLPAIRPGQFFTLLVELDGETHRRAYSVSSDCRVRDRFSVTIKRVVDGRVSNHLNDHAAPGQRLRVLGPSGEFARALAGVPKREAARKLVLIAGGSGITPMMGLIRTLLSSESNPHQFALIYANRDAEQVIFAAELHALAAEHRGRLAIHEILEQPPIHWTGARGRCDRPTLSRLLDASTLAHGPEAEFLLCGPAPMMAIARELLEQRGVTPARVHSESFLAPRLDASASAKTLRPQPVTLIVDQREIDVVVQPGQTLLDAGLAAGLALPYSCTMGGCAACKVKLERGAVVMREPNCLAANERAAGHVLACVAKPTEPCRVRVVANDHET